MNKDDAIRKRMEEFIENSVPQQSASLNDEEFVSLSEEFERKFGRKPYIAEPSGTVEQAKEAIKECLNKNEDILDEIYYPLKEVLY